MKNGWLRGKKEIAEYCGFCVKTLNKILKTHKMPIKKLGGMWKGNTEDLNAWLKKYKLR